MLFKLAEGMDFNKYTGITWRLFIYLFIYMKLFMVDGVSCISALTTALWDFGDGLSSSFLLALKLGRCCKVFILIANKFQVLFSLSVKPNRGFRDHFAFQ